MIQRIFHPIGQGAFYSERHGDFNIVYDCGEWKNSKWATKIVEGSFNQEEEIDVLFISHFDYDHVNKIEALKENFKIKKVVLPLLHENEKIFLEKIYSKSAPRNKKILQLILNPEEYFGEDVIIINVDKFEKKERLKFEKKESLEFEKISETITIKSGTPLKKGDWVYVPYNIEYQTRKAELEEAFKKKKLDIEKIRTDKAYLTKNRKNIKEAYDLVKGNINKNSMLVYSGPEEEEHKYININYSCKYPPCFFSPIHENRVACIYTGDSNLNEVNINEIYLDYWENIGTIQIPHHGDSRSFDSQILDKNYWCPISLGNTNTYGHPSNQLVADISLTGSSPIIITEDAQTIYIQNIGTLTDI